MPGADPPSPVLGWPHLLVLAPIVGLPLIVGELLRAPDEHKAELRLALRYQGLAAAVVGLHAVLHAGIWFVGYLFATVPQPSTPLHDLVPALLVVLYVVNGVAGAAEWAFLAVLGLRASRGQPYPIGGGS
jgi:hypothetical protein